MSQTVITAAFEEWKAQEAAGGNRVVLDGFVLANVPGLDPDAPISNTETLPPDSQIVYRQDVDKTGVVNNNAVVYSITMGSNIGTFDFNWIGLVNKASGVLAMIVHTPMQRKLKTEDGQQGNAINRSFLMEYDGAATETQINTPAQTWQIDFTARLSGMDEEWRLANFDIYGPGAFFGDGFLVKKDGSKYQVQPGNGYIGGVRATLSASEEITAATLPAKVFADVSWQGALTGRWQSVTTVQASTTDLIDYIDGDGFAHYVFAVASIDAAGAVTDLRPIGSIPAQVADGAVKSVSAGNNTHKPDENGNVKLGSAADADIVTSMTDTTAGRVPVVGWEGLGGYALQTTDAELQSSDRLPTRFFTQGEGDVDKRFGRYGAGVHIEYGTNGDGVEFSANMFVRADGNIIVEWLQVNADGSVNLQKQQMLFGPFNLPSAADIRAVALSSVFAKADTDIADASALPANTVSFCYSDAAFSPGYEATILDVGGLGDGSGYRVQYAASYADGGKQLKFRTLNGNNGYWGNWTNVITNYGGDVDHLSNASYYHANPAAWPGVGAFANQYADPTAPFTIPYGRVTPKGISQYLPIIKALSATEEYGFGAAVSFGILRTGNNDFGSAVIHIIGDNGSMGYLTLDINGNLGTSGQIIPGNYANLDARYLSTGSTLTRLGAEVIVGVPNHATVSAPAGCVQSAVRCGSDGSLTGMGYRPLQVLVNGTWVNVQSL